MVNVGPRYNIGIAASLSGSSAVALAEDGTLIAFAEAGGFHWRQNDFGDIAATLGVMFEQLAKDSKQRLPAFNARVLRICIGVTGTDWRFKPSAGSLFRDHCGTKIDTSVSFSSIAEVAHAGAALMRPGITVRSGGGCSVYGISSKEAIHLSNAWSAWGGAGDAGSGYSIGRRLLDILARSHDGRATKAETAFSDRALELLQFKSVPELFGRLLPPYNSTNGKHVIVAISELRQTVFSLAERHDAVAVQLVERAADDIVAGVVAVARRTGLCRSRRTLRIHFQGGTFRNYPPFEDLVFEKVKARYKIAHVPSGETGYVPSVGAAFMASVAFPDHKNLERKIEPLALALAKDPRAHALMIKKVKADANAK